MTRTLSTILLQVGVIAVVVVATPYKLFELDRYFVPKELALHAIALALAILLILQRRELRRDITDSLLVLFIAWSAGSAIFATNHWLAQRALGLSVSSAIVFWSARRLGRTEAYRGVLAGCAVATVLAAVFCLLQAYGVETEYFSTNRAPGGTFGNRNFVAHMAVIGLPALVWSTVTARKPGSRAESNASRGRMAMPSPASTNALTMSTFAPENTMLGSRPLLANSFRIFAWPCEPASSVMSG